MSARQEGVRAIATTLEDEALRLEAYATRAPRLVRSCLRQRAKAVRQIAAELRIDVESQEGKP